MRFAGPLLIALPFAAAIAPSGTVQASDGQSDPIVVRGTRLDPADARQRAVEFVKRAGVANGQQQVARWVIPVCIKVIGLSTPQSARVEDLMLQVAREAKIPVERPGCEPNITVIFTADAGQVARYIHSRRPHQLRELDHVEREQVLNGSAPVRWWYATQMLDREGMKGNNITPGSISAAPGDGPSQGAPGPISMDGGDFVTTNQYNSGSHVRTPTIRSLYGATVVVDAPAAGSTSIDSIAAYAAMVAFAEMNAGAPPPDSILGLFQPDSIETSLTDWDMAFLKSLYRMPLERRARIQRGHLVEALLDERLPNKSEAQKP